jgi:uncharacterized protein with ParB-like and HNH nuclease domain
MKISQILDKVDDNQLFVPAFQREYVWKRKDAKSLFESLLNEFPTGSLLTWETSQPPELKGSVQYNSSMGAIKLILDGQQRITTLYMLIRGKFPPYYNEEEIENDVRNLYIEVEKKELSFYKQQTMQDNPLWIKLSDIFNNKIRFRDVRDALKPTGHTISSDRQDIIEDNFDDIKKVPDQEFLEQAVPVKATLSEAINIFYKVNASGIRLTEAELALAQICGYWPKARKVLKDKISDLESEGFPFKLDLLVYMLQGIQYHSGSSMEKLHPAEENEKKLPQVWKKLSEDTLPYVINLLKQHAFVDHSKEVSSLYSLVPIVVYVLEKENRSGKKTLTEEEINKIVKWFFYSQLRQRYAHQHPGKLDKDINIVINSDNPFDELIELISKESNLNIQPHEFEGADIRSPIYRLMRWYFKSLGAICPHTGSSIRKNMGKKYSLQQDHIFPYSILSKNGYSKKDSKKFALAQECTNRMILTEKGNLSKSDRPADIFLSEVEKNFPGSLKKQCIPESPELWRLENFETFLKTRRKILAEELNLFLEGLAEPVDVSSEVTIEELLSYGESNELEFKSTLRWNIASKQTDKNIEKAISKTIAAFSNADGGVLIIGVDDDGNILGLESDYSTLEGDQDNFELHLRELIKRDFGPLFSKENININFHEIEDQEICQVQISKGIKPTYLDVTDKMGNKNKKFYARSGNSSIEIPINEVAEYIKSRF